MWLSKWLSKTRRKISRDLLIRRICKSIKKNTGLPRKFIETHTLWQIEEALGIGHYRIIEARDYRCYYYPSDW